MELWLMRKGRSLLLTINPNYKGRIKRTFLKRALVCNKWIIKYSKRESTVNLLHLTRITRHKWMGCKRNKNFRLIITWSIRVLKAQIIIKNRNAFLFNNKASKMSIKLFPSLRLFPLLLRANQKGQNVLCYFSKRTSESKSRGGFHF